jgi:hypothetical protein
MQKLQNDWQCRLVDTNEQEFEFSGNLLDEADITKEHLRSIDQGYNSPIFALDFDKIKSLGFDGIICHNPSKAIFKDWDVPSVVVWSNLEKLTLLSEKSIDYPVQYAISQIYIEFYNLDLCYALSERDRNLYDIFDDDMQTIIRNGIPDCLKKYPDYHSIYSEYKLSFKKLDDEIILLNFTSDNYTMVKYHVSNENDHIKYIIICSFIINDNIQQLFTISKEFKIKELNQKKIDEELNFIKDLFI